VGGVFAKLSRLGSPGAHSEAEFNFPAELFEGLDKNTHYRHIPSVLRTVWRFESDATPIFLLNFLPLK
jgi:hypothetical protein